MHFISFLLLFLYIESLMCNVTNCLKTRHLAHCNARIFNINVIRLNLIIFLVIMIILLKPTLGNMIIF